MAYDAANRRRTLEPTPPATAKVTRVDASGAVWATPIGEDTRHPEGPLLGAAGSLVGDLVLLIYTDEGTWVAGRERR